jgi:UrcA family protein
MSSQAAVINSRFALGAAIACSTLIAGNVAARDVTVAIKVQTRGLDLNRPAVARQLYMRLEYAAWQVCTHGNQVALAPVSNPRACHEKALADAVRSVNRPLLTQVYLTTHTLGEAAAHGIEVPAQVAAK